MAGRKNGESPNKAVTKVLERSEKPLVAYEILDRLKGQGINAPPTVYRALEKLVKTGVAHRIASNHSYFMCNHDSGHESGTLLFAICRLCQKVEEIVDTAFAEALRCLREKSGFKVEQEVMEMTGLCRNCKQMEPA